MEEEFNKMVDRIMIDKATLQVQKELELAFDQSDGYRYNNYGYVSLDINRQSKDYTYVAESSKKKAFRKYFLKYYEGARCERNAMIANKL